MATIEEIIMSVQSAAAEMRLAIFQGIPDLDTRIGKQFPVATWGGEWLPFIELAKRSGTTMLYLDTVHFDYESTVREATNLEEEIEDEEDPEDVGSVRWLYERIVEQTEEWRSRTGDLAHIQCYWLKGGIAHCHIEDSEWASAFYKVVDAAIRDARNVRQENRVQVTNEKTSRLYQCAEQMARHERYVEASNEAKRQFMAEKLFPEHDGDHRRIAELAGLIYWWEVEPSDRATIAVRVNDLYHEGLSVKNIATTLKMPEAKVKALLADSERLV
jgi:hypothetical protein